MKNVTRLFTDMSEIRRRFHSSLMMSIDRETALHTQHRWSRPTLRTDPRFITPVRHPEVTSAGLTRGSLAMKLFHRSEPPIWAEISVAAPRTDGIRPQCREASVYCWYNGQWKCSGELAARCECRDRWHSHRQPTRAYGKAEASVRTTGPTVSRTIAIDDIHGCSTSLEALIDG